MIDKNQRRRFLGQTANPELRPGAIERLKMKHMPPGRLPPSPPPAPAEAQTVRSWDTPPLERKIVDPTPRCGLLVAEDGTPVGHVDRHTGVHTRVDAWGTHPLPEAPAHKLNADQTVVVSTEVFWNEDMTACPRNAKVQLLGQGGVAMYKEYTGDPFWVGWAPVPKRRAKP